MALTPLASMIRQLMTKGHDKNTAEKIATKHLQKVGVLKQGTMRMTDYGKARHEIEQTQRKIRRVAQKSGKPEHYYQIDTKGNVKLNQLFK